MEAAVHLLQDSPLVERVKETLLDWVTNGRASPESLLGGMVGMLSEQPAHIQTGVGSFSV